MAVKDLLVAYQGDESAQNALRFALQMAEKHQANLTGVHVHAPNEYDSATRRWIPEDVMEVMRKAEVEAVQRVEQSFRDIIQKTNPSVAHEWTALHGPPGLLLARMARFYDILVTGQFEGAIRHGGRSVQPEELIRRAGKPMIAVPEGYQIRPFTEEAVVAWDGSSSAARALTDAMHILETKKRLHVVTVAADGSERVAPLGEHDIVQHLERHGIDAKQVHLKKDGVAGKTILEYCRDVDPDVLVMGAFGRGKLGTMLFGSTSQYVLEHQTLPILISH